MVWPPQDTGTFEFKMPCCTCEIGCPGGFLIYATGFVNGTPFADEAAAQARLDDPLRVANCMAYHFPATFPVENLDTFSATGGSTLHITAAQTVPGAVNGGLGNFLCGSVNLEAGSTLSVDYSAISAGTPPAGYTVKTNVTVFLLDCFGATISQVDDGGLGVADVSGTATFAIADAGEYWVVVLSEGIFEGPLGTSATPTSLTVDHLVSSDDTLTVNPIIAVWDDGGNNAYLECT